MRIRSLQLTLLMCLTRLLFAGCPTPVVTQGTTLTGANGSGLVVADFDKDGKTDYAVPNAGGQKVVIFLGHGDGTFATGVQYTHGGTGGGRLLGADFNGDTFTDVAVLVGDSGSNYAVILLNNGNGTFGDPKRITTPVSNIAFSLKAVDMNDDGKMDLIASGEFAQIFYGAGDGTFSSEEKRFPSTLVHAVAGADVNNDGRTDLIITGAQIPIGGPETDQISIYLRGPGGLPFSPTTTYTARDANGGDIFPADLDGDGFRDLAVTFPPSRRVSVYHNLGNGTFDPPIEYNVFNNPNEELQLIAPGDINEDGIIDLTFGALNADDATIMVGNGDGTFQPAYHLFLTAPSYYLQLQGVGVGDINGDGRPDILLSEQNQSSVFVVLNGCPSRYAAVTLGSSANPSIYGSPVTITATVTARNGGHAGGTVSFTDGVSPLGTVSLSGATPSTAAVTIPKFTLGSHTIHADYSGDATYGASSGKMTQTVNRPTFAVPLDFTATGNQANNTIALQWIGSTEATGYEVARMSGGVWNVIGTPASESFTDSNVSPSQGYFYRVQALKTGNLPSGYTTPDAATTYVFAHTFAVGGNIFAVDMTDLRTCANALRAAAGLSPVLFTDSNLAGVLIKAEHMTDLRSALSLAMTTSGMPAPSFSQSIVANSSRVLAADFIELRTMMR